MQKTLFLGVLVSFLFLLTGCGRNDETNRTIDTNEILGIETPETCEFGCLVGSNWKIGGRDDSAIEVSRFTSPELGITFLYASSLLYTYDGSNRVEGTHTIIHTGNSLCLKESGLGTTFVSGKEDGCVEFFPYEEREHLDASFGAGEKNVYVDASEAFPEGRRTYGTNGVKKSIPALSLYFVEYHCIACAPGPDFSWIQTIETINKEFNTSEKSGKYLRIDGTAEIASGMMQLEEDAMGYLHFPTGKYSTLYLSGNGESHVFLLNKPSYQNPELIQKQIANLNSHTYLEDEILYDFYQVSGYTGWHNALMIMSDWGNLSTIFDLPTDKALQYTTTLISFLQDPESEVFWELSNKETSLVNEGGAVMKYLKGEDYTPAYQGLDIYGEVVPRTDGFVGL